MGVDTIPTGIATGVAGSLLAKEVVTVVPGLGSVLLAAGVYAMYAVGANVKVQVQDSTGTWQDVTIAGESEQFVYSDGTNFRLTNTAAGNQNATLIKIG